MNTTGSVPRLDPSLPQVFGRYLLVQRLSRGGMGEIFLAKHGLQGFEKLCVIKKVLPNLAEDQQFISRFVDEAQVAIKLQHVNVAQVFEVGRVGDEYFLSIEYVEGRDLRRILHVLGKHRRRFPPELALYIGREMANGLAYAHRRTSVDGASLELVHCDISPPNVLVSFEGETKIIDFGIAKSALRETATDPKMGFGKFGYMAPEQLIRGGVVDHRTDIYAAGVVLFELLTGERLYELGPDGQAPDYRALARAVSRGEHKVPSDLDPLLEPFDELVRRALKPRAEDRYQTAAELRDAIQTELVQLNPTISADQLGSFMRDTFAAEMSAHRDMVERIAHTHLDQFKDQLTTQSVATVSFALANMPLVAPTEEPRAVRAAPQRHDQQSTAVAGMMIADSGRTATVELGDRDLLPLDARRGQPRDRRRLSWPVIGATSVAVIVAVALAVWAAGGGSRPPAPAAGSTAVGGGAGGVAADAGAPTVTALDPADVVVADADADAGEPAIEIDPIVEPPPGDPSPPPRDGGKARVRTAKSKGDDHAAKARVDHGDDKPAPTVDADAVLGKFKAVSREYKTFKQAYGARLDAEWTELATLAQYAGKSPDKLAALDRKLDRFRSQMRAQK
ncbi:MAG: serine/threonine protein kinase [Kofleriaceae bacterium]|nr:serine/threonine protein kinase [Kofleriaceae bacterium]